MHGADRDQCLQFLSAHRILLFADLHQRPIYVAAIRVGQIVAQHRGSLCHLGDSAGGVQEDLFLFADCGFALIRLVAEEGQHILNACVDFCVVQMGLCPDSVGTRTDGIGKLAHHQTVPAGHSALHAVRSGFDSRHSGGNRHMDAVGGLNEYGDLHFCLEFGYQISDLCGQGSPRVITQGNGHSTAGLRLFG